MSRSWQDVKRAYEDWLLSLPEVVGVGLGLEGIRVYVRSKARFEVALGLRGMPILLEGVPVYVVESGDLHAFQNTGKWRPVSGGVSVGQPYWGTGTLSVIVQDRATKRKLILSNNHVLAKSNSDLNQWAKAGDPIIQPGEVDGGREELETVGNLIQWIDIQSAPWNGTTWVGPDNIVDCALAEPLNPNLASTDILDVGVVSGVVEPILSLQVLKSGRTTGITHGQIVDIDFKGLINYDVFMASFAHQIVVQATPGPFSSPGDSGSLVVDNSNAAVGLLFAGNADTNITVCNRIAEVLNALSIEFSSENPVIQNLVAITPVGKFEVVLQDGSGKGINGAIFLDKMYIGSGRVVFFATVGSHTLSFGSVPGYVTPQPMTIQLPEYDGASYQTLTVVYKKTTVSIVQQIRLALSKRPIIGKFLKYP